MFTISPLFLFPIYAEVCDTVVPTLEDFMGTSNKVKEATTVILIAPDDELMEENTIWYLKPTWICIRKDRFNGCKNLAGKVVFNINTCQYENKCVLFKINYWGTKVSILPENEQLDYESFNYIS